MSTNQYVTLGRSGLRVSPLVVAVGIEANHVNPSLTQPRPKKFERH